MKKSDYMVAAVLILVVVIAVKYFRPQEPEQPLLDLPSTTNEQPASVEVPEPAIRYPIPAHPPQIEQPTVETATTEPGLPQEEPTEEVAESAPEKPLPTLDGSDAAVRESLYTLAARQAIDSLFNLNRIIRRFVVTVDNLPRKHLTRSKYRSNQAISGQLRVEEDSNGIYLSKDNYARYDAFIDLFESINNDQLIALYLHYYPLIQAAYDNLGYSAAYFNDRLIDVIDHLLQAPDLGGRIALIRPRVLYKYVDPELEALSAGQKVLIRIGPRNAARVKSKLRELRQALAGE